MRLSLGGRAGGTGLGEQLALASPLLLSYPQSSPEIISSCTKKTSAVDELLTFSSVLLYVGHLKLQGPDWLLGDLESTSAFGTVGNHPLAEAAPHSCMQLCAGAGARRYVPAR